MKQSKWIHHLRLAEIPVFDIAPAMAKMGWGEPPKIKRPSVLSSPSCGF
jgi:hypothetical protein